ncbi:MAG TPA: hypothetical protein VMU83_11710 [Hanamia sp.]|nr:hypothetical protein [Hanamia sp.]
MKESVCLNHLQLTTLQLAQDIFLSTGEKYLEGQFICIGKHFRFGARKERRLCVCNSGRIITVIKSTL